MGLRGKQNDERDEKQDEASEVAPAERHSDGVATRLAQCRRSDLQDRGEQSHFTNLAHTCVTQPFIHGSSVAFSVGGSMSVGGVLSRWAGTTSRHVDGIFAALSRPGCEWVSRRGRKALSWPCAAND